jgi:hypothetical protein
MVTVTVFPDIAISAQPVGGSICTGGNFDLSVTASGSPNIHYQWEAFNGTTWSIRGTDSPNYNTGTLTSTTNIEYSSMPVRMVVKMYILPRYQSL